jgi:hypothetical protein
MRLIGLAVALTLSLTPAPLAAEAQTADRIYRLGFLGQTSAPDLARQTAAFRQGADTRKVEISSSNIAGRSGGSTACQPWRPSLWA